MLRLRAELSGAKHDLDPLRGNRCTAEHRTALRLEYESGKHAVTAVTGGAGTSQRAHHLARRDGEIHGHAGVGCKFNDAQRRLEAERVQRVMLESDREPARGHSAEAIAPPRVRYRAEHARRGLRLRNARCRVEQYGLHDGSWQRRMRNRIKNAAAHRMRHARW